MRKRKYQRLTNGEREEISRYLARKLPIAKIANLMKRNTSTIYRGIKRNRGKTGYRAFGASRRAQRAATSRRKGKSKIAKSVKLKSGRQKLLAVQFLVIGKGI